MIRVFGLGNPARGDDGAGPAVVDRLRADAAADMQVGLCGEDPTDLLERWSADDRVVVVDASAAQGQPGRIRRFDVVARPLPARHFAVSTHGVGLGGAIELGRTLGRLPRSLVVYAIEGVDFSTGRGLSPQVERSVDEVAGRVLREAHRSDAVSGQ